MNKRNFTSLVPTAANQWQRMAGEDAACVGTFIQNQAIAATPNANANFWVCNREPVRLTDAQQILPGTGLLEDILAGQEEVWVYTDTLGAALTFTRKYHY